MSSSKTLRTKQIEVCIWPVGHSLLTADLGEKFDKVWKKKDLAKIFPHINVTDYPLCQLRISSLALAGVAQ